MRRLVVAPDGWPCVYEECPPGLFAFNGELCLKDQYGAAGAPYIAETGEISWGGTTSQKDRDRLVVQPCKAVWEEFED